MSERDELLKQFSDLGLQARKLESDGGGNLLLNPNNQEDVEWYENDTAYEIIQNEFSIDQQGSMISKDKSSDVILGEGSL